MSQQPVWLTDEGSLGTVPEGRFYRISLVAMDPDDPLDPTQITYTLLAGSLPAGVAVQRNGTIEGIPISVADFKGVPSAVSENTTSKFTIRATTDELRLKDRTFTLTVTGQDAPEFITPAGLIAGYFDGDQVNFQFEVSDDDPNDRLTIKQISGEIPPGTVLSDEGLLSGYIEPVPDADSAFIGYDIDGSYYDEYPYDFDSRSIDKQYQFTLEVTDGKDVDIRTFEIAVLSRDGITADSTNHTVDSTFITADMVSTRQPFLTEYIPDFGRIRHDNFFAYQFKGQDPNGVNSNLRYTLYSGTLPETLQLDYVTGWMSGYLSDVNLSEVLYEFQIQLAIAQAPDDTSAPVVSIPYAFEFTVVGLVETEVIWLTPRDLGSIANGEISTLYVKAVHKNTLLLYRLKPGMYNKLPQGLNLNQSGNIVGRASFKTFTLDNSTTTFDADVGTRLEVGEETTFDRTYIFNVEAYSTDGFVSVTKEFVIHLEQENDQPYNSLYAKAMPPENDRKIINDLLRDPEIMVPELLYRSDDLNFGVAKEVIYQHVFGLTPATLEEYFASFSLNHYHKTVTLGEIKTARALDENGRVLYEVVYSQIIDDMVNQDGVSVSKEVDLSAGAINHGEGGELDVIINEVFPNSFYNMREQVVDQIGQISKVLPTWMLSKQSNGRILGFTPAWVIAYTNPGQSDLLAYKLGNEFKEHLNQVDFTIDRFILDNQLTKDWDLCDDEYYTADTTILNADSTKETTDSGEPECEIGWVEGVMTTFDRIPPLVDITADNTIVTCDSDRYINNTSAEPIDDEDGSTETIFDGGSCRFMSPVDKWEDTTVTDKYDKYIMFPQVNITNTIPINTGEEA